MVRITTKEAAGVYAALLKGQEFVDNCGLDPRLVALISFRVSQINSCAHCLDMHYKEAVHMGEGPVKVISVSAWRETPYYTPKEQAALAFAEYLTHMPSEHRSEGIHDELSLYFTKEEIASLTMVVIQINSWNRLVRSFGSEPGKYKAGDKKAAVTEA